MASEKQKYSAQIIINGKKEERLGQRGGKGWPFDHGGFIVF